MNYSAYRPRYAWMPLLAIFFCAAAAIPGIAYSESPPAISATTELRQISEGPVPEEPPDASAIPRGAGSPIGNAWHTPATTPRGTPAELYTNGEPLDDLGHPASQLSETPAVPPWVFGCAVADDFSIPNLGNPSADARVSLVRVAFYFFGPGFATATPANTWTEVIVTVYPNSLSNKPGGEPDGNGGNVGSVVPGGEVHVAQASLLNQQGPFGVCRTYYLIDIPVDIVLAKNVTYWLSVVPRYPAPPQTAWFLSNTNTGFPAARGFPSASIPYWTTITGNQQSPACSIVVPPNPPPGTNRDVTFKLYGEDLPATEGACCNFSTGQCVVTDAPTCAGPFEQFYPAQGCASVGCTQVTGACCDDAFNRGMACNENVPIGDCQGPTFRFSEGGVCADFDPPCGTVIDGACCFNDGHCENLSPALCFQGGATWHAGVCGVTFFCPPMNDDCADALTITDGSTPFDTTGAITDGPADTSTPPCTNVGQDIWYKYTASCTGTLSISLCAGTSYDAALVVYHGFPCLPLGTIAACDNDSCGSSGAPPSVSLAVTSGEELLLRVGGAGSEFGSGTIYIGCVPTDSGACCHANATCDVTTPASCNAVGDSFQIDVACSPGLCPTVTTGACCHANATCTVTTPPPADCNALGDSFQVDVACSPGLCPTVSTGACCHPDSSCDMTTMAGCISPDMYQDGVPCSPNPCPPPPTGACCHSDGGCTDTTQAACNAPGDVYHDAVPCTPGLCPLPPLCCLGDVNADCVLSALDLQGFVDALIGVQPAAGTEAFCRLDADQSGTIDDADVTPFVELILSGGACGVVTTCCKGDMNLDGLRDGRDVQLFIETVMLPPSPCSLAACSADTDDSNSVNDADAASFIDLILTGAPCPP